MSDYIGVVTNIGQAKIAAAIGGTALNLATIRVGDGNGAPIVPNAAMVDLVRRVGAAYPIISSGRDPVNANHWRVTALIPVNDGPFDIREIGVWDAAGEMIAVAKHVLVEKRTPAQGAAVEILTDIVFPVSETAQVTVQVTPAAQISIFQMLRTGFLVVESATLANPPGAPALGRTHVVPAGATGAWIGLAGYLVQWNGIAWVAVNPPEGFVVVAGDKAVDSTDRWLRKTAGGWGSAAASTSAFGPTMLATPAEAVAAASTIKAPSVDAMSEAMQAGRLTYAAAGGTANSWTIDPNRAISAYSTGRVLWIKPPATNTSAVVVASVCGLGDRLVKKADGSNPKPGDYNGKRWYPSFDDGANIRIISTLASDFSRVGRTQVFLQSGTFMPADDVYSCRSRVLAGGGGGGGGPNASNNAGGGGGAAGGYAEKWCEVTPGVGVAVTVGAGGVGGPVGGNGGTGGSSSFGPHCSASPGGGGSYLGNSPSIGGVGTGGDVNLYGSGGQQGMKDGTTPVGAPGGGPPFGGGSTSNSYATGYSAQGYGAGGGGAGGLGNAGGAGAPGLVIVEW